MIRVPAGGKGGLGPEESNRDGSGVGRAGPGSSESSLNKLDGCVLARGVGKKMGQASKVVALAENF